MEEFPGNSMKAKEAAEKKAAPKKAPPEKKVEKIVTGEVVKRKTPFTDRFKGVFFGGEFKTATSYIFSDVLIPALKNLIVDMTSKGVDRLVYGERSNRRPHVGQTGTRIQYHNPSRFSSPSRGMLPDQPPLGGGRRPSNSANNIILQSREEAESVLESLVEIVDVYQVASLADLYALVGLPTTHVDNKWGWTNLKFSGIRQIREGYLLDLPDVESID